MINYNLHQAASITGATLIGKPCHFRGISIDSRTDCSHKLFIAIQGPHFNGENYCQQAIDNGAIAILVSSPQDINIPQLICNNSLKALTVLAKNWAKQCQAKIIAITGSNGKTTVKNMLKSILSIANQCSATQGNLNNEIGVPLTLCNIHANDKYAIIEMGAAQLGDISYLVSLVDIETAVLTNVSAAHIGRFGSLENIVHEKGKIFSNQKETQHCILPFDDDNYSTWVSASNCKILNFGTNNDADIRVETNKTFNLLTKSGSIEDIKLPIAGQHNQLNAACAASAAISLGINYTEIKQGLQNFISESGRLEDLGIFNGNRIINDSYNANPQSVKAAINVLATYNHPTTLVFGDMAELGTDSQQLHQAIGHYCKQQNISHLLTIGADSKYASMAFSDNIQHFDSINSLKNHLLENWSQFGSILVKGSRSMHLENLINGLTDSEKVA